MSSPLAETVRCANTAGLSLKRSPSSRRSKPSSEAKNVSAPTFGQNRPEKGQSRPGGLINGIDVAALGRVLRGRWPFDTAGYASVATGINYETVRNWLKARCAPNAAHLVRLTAVLDADEIKTFWPDAPPWLDFAALEAEEARLRKVADDANARIEAIRSERRRMGEEAS